MYVKLMSWSVAQSNSKPTSQLNLVSPCHGPLKSEARLQMVLL